MAHWCLWWRPEPAALHANAPCWIVLAEFTPPLRECAAFKILVACAAVMCVVDAPYASEDVGVVAVVPAVGCVAFHEVEYCERLVSQEVVCLLNVAVWRCYLPAAAVVSGEVVFASLDYHDVCL